MTAAAVVLLEYLAAQLNRLRPLVRTIDVLIGRRIGDQPQHKRDHRFAFLKTERKLRHAQPLVVTFVLGLVIIEAAGLFQLLIDKARAMPGIDLIRVVFELLGGFSRRRRMGLLTRPPGMALLTRPQCRM